MASTARQPVPTWFWVVSILALLWELGGVYAYLTQVTMTAADLSALPEGQRTLFGTMPPWVTGAYAIAVFGGSLAAIGLLLRKAWARPLFLVSLVALLFQFGWVFGAMHAYQLVGPSSVPLPATVILLGIVFAWFSGLAIKRGWLA